MALPHFAVHEEELAEVDGAAAVLVHLVQSSARAGVRPEARGSSTPKRAASYLLHNGLERDVGLRVAQLFKHALELHKVDVAAAVLRAGKGPVSSGRDDASAAPQRQLARYQTRGSAS